MCQFSGRQNSFLCPNGTVFNQQVLTCDHWRNVDCGQAQALYGVNDKLYVPQRKDPVTSNNSVLKQLTTYWLSESSSGFYQPITNRHVTTLPPFPEEFSNATPFLPPITSSHVSARPTYTPSTFADRPYNKPISDRRRSTDIPNGRHLETPTTLGIQEEVLEGFEPVSLNKEHKVTHEDVLEGYEHVPINKELHTVANEEVLEGFEPVPINLQRHVVDPLKVKPFLP
nr:uncharacterized protein LOC123761708 [Procambarus clarkii]